jgi:hypothetical protein
MLSAFTPEEQERIKAGLFFHTIENDDDGFLMLDTENLERVAAAITETAADVVIYDPLRDFSLDDLNSDKYMGDTLREITRVTKRGNPKRTALVIHHAATGKAGVQKTTGFDRSSFGRNSKVLFAWTRAQINVAPAKGEDNSLIIVASGKCNDAPEFEKFAARLNFDTMLYARDDDFDMEEWHREITATSSKSRVKADVLRELLVKGREYEKREIVAFLRDEKAISKARAYEIVDEGKAARILRLNKVMKTYALL